MGQPGRCFGAAGRCDGAAARCNSRHSGHRDALPFATCSHWCSVSFLQVCLHLSSLVLWRLVLGRSTKFLKECRNGIELPKK